jgi:hypothetical protein
MEEVFSMYKYTVIKCSGGGLLVSDSRDKAFRAINPFDLICSVEVIAKDKQDAEILGANAIRERGF